MSFTIGQRWVSQTEPKLGLGIISESANRRVTISFPAAGETRTYAMENAPISRVSYKAGDKISNHEEQSFIVTGVDDTANLIHYQIENGEGQRSTMSEVDLNCFIQFTSPLQRLMSGHYDRNRAFRLRYETLQHLHRLQQSPVSGLVGSRTSLLGHQLYIADRVAQRHSPRVLLADEVGLGKTIEAGMILHAQLHKALAQRVLITVPSTLVHQWLVEMLRRFNLRFSVFDQERFQALKDEGMENPFESEQLILCDLDFIASDEDVQIQAIAAGWDMLVVDEAHHLHWSEHQSSVEYQCVEALASVSAGVLLLTATPEQAGVDSHFARLRLLDPDRFHSLSEFITQEQNYAQISALVGAVQAADPAQPLPAPLISQLDAVLGKQSEVDFSVPAADSVPKIVQRLLDQHGTGRILFRNTRQAVAGFPQRVLQAYPLPAADDEVYDLQSDPRLQWLIDTLRQLKPEKVLVICSTATRALEIECHLRLKEGMRTAAFYEGLSIIERDRAAAYFADKDEGAQALICSEIGSEGRNFQFAHHLVLFDLPENPDLLEQRIGRLDRIGQQQDVNIHVPYVEQSRQEGLFHWYHLALNAFTQSCAAGYAIYEHFQEELERYLAQGEFQQAAASDHGNACNAGSGSDSEQTDGFIQRARHYRDQAMAELQQGRDPLLELNSCNAEVAEALIEQVSNEEASQTLSGYMDRIFNLYGVEQEHQSDSTVIIHPGEHMLTHDFPGLSDEGCTLTYHRLKALVREEIEFLSWEHPMVVESMEQTVSSELGNAALATMSVKGVPAGTLFLEAVFVINSMAPKSLQLDRFLPLTPIRVVVDANGRDLSEVLVHEKLNELCSGLKRKMAHAVVKEIRGEMETLLEKAQALVAPNVPDILSAASDKLCEHLDEEIQRMVSLQVKNALIRDEEIEILRQRKQQGLSYIAKSGLDVQAMRLVINT